MQLPCYHTWDLRLITCTEDWEEMKRRFPSLLNLTPLMPPENVLSVDGNFTPSDTIWMIPAASPYATARRLGLQRQDLTGQSPSESSKTQLE